MKMLALVIALLVVAAHGSAQAAGGPTGWLPLATYLNDATHEAQAARVRAALDARGIHSVTTCSLGCTLSVEAARWADARTILHQLVAREHLDVSDAVVVTS